MSRPARPWFRFYVEAVHDRKLRRLRPEHRWLFVACLSSARQSPVPGLLLVAAGSPMTNADLADYSGMAARSVRVGLAALLEEGILAYDTASGTWSVTNWNARQYESDVSTARVRRSRERGNDVTETAVVTPPDTETDTDTPLPPSASNDETPRPALPELDPVADPTCPQCQGRGVKGYALVGERDKAHGVDVPCDCTLPDYQPRPARVGPPADWIDPLAAKREREFVDLNAISQTGRPPLSTD